MFKVGDKVRVKDDAFQSTSGRGLRGKTGIITKVSTKEGWYGHYASLDIEKRLIDGICGGVYLVELELVETKKENKQEKQMGKVNYHRLSDSIVINHNAKTTVLREGDHRYNQVLKCIQESRLSEIPELLDVESAFAKVGLDLRDGALFMDNEALPESLSHRVIQMVEENMPIDIMVRFWTNLKANPSFNSRKMLYQFLEHNGHPLTEDGCFIAYRGVTEDFRDKHTRTMNNAVGTVVEISRDQVDDNPNNTCSHGLHVACFDYAKGFGERLVEVKVNPKDVVTVPVDYNGTKMRVCKFEVMAECESELKGTVYKPETLTKKPSHSLRGPDGKFVKRA